MLRKNNLVDVRRAALLGFLSALLMLLCVTALSSCGSCTQSDLNPARGSGSDDDDDTSGDDDSADDDDDADDDSGDDDVVPPGAYVDQAGVVGQYTSLALDTHDNIHIAYYSKSDGLKYAYWDGSIWSLNVVDDGSSNIGLYTSLRLEPGTTTAHISYYDAANGDLKYATGSVVKGHSSKAWDIETVSETDDVGKYSSLDLNASDLPAIVAQHIGDSGKNLMYFVKSGANWAAEVVDAQGNVGSFASLAFNPSTSNPCVAYYDETNGDLKFAERKSGTWTVEVVDSSGDVGRWANMRIDAMGNENIAYVDEGRGRLKFARRLSGDTGWNIEVLDATGKAGADAKVAVDSTFKPVVLYQDQDFLDIKLAKRNGDQWDIQTLLTDGIYGFWLSLALDSGDNPVFSHYYYPDQDLLIYPPR